MADEHYDVLVVGSGPAGAVAALVLARHGARVALVDKATFPRDKACGDLIGPRGVALLDDLGLTLPTDVTLGDMLVVGPTGTRVRLPARAGSTYPGHGVAVRRSVFDALLHEAAVEAGAVPVTGRAGEPLQGEHGRIDGFTLDDGRRLRAEVVIGADGATSRVGEVAGLVDATRVLWGFAVRTYLPASLELPVVVLWDETPWHAFAGYGWIFPGPGGTANAGLGIGVGRGGSRRLGAGAVRLLPAFLDHLTRLDLLERGAWSRSEGNGGPPARLGGWLKMGMVGTTPAACNVLLVGDAAGLVNPLQGEGIAQAMASGQAAAQAVLAGPPRAARRYTDHLAAAHLPFEQVAAAAHSALVGRPRVTSVAGRVLTLPGLGPALAGGWALMWNELLDGALPGRARMTAAAVTGVGRAVVSAGPTARWFRHTFTTRPPPGQDGTAHRAGSRPPGRPPR